MQTQSQPVQTQFQIHKDQTGLKVLWDERKKCYCFEDQTGQLLPFTLTMTPHDSDPERQGYDGPTLEALLAISKHHTQSKNQGELRCKEYDLTASCADLGIWNLQQRKRRLQSEFALST